ncbi:MAG TPA: APC family permease [Acidobacteriota bacterium]|nr:APC family permease [Acidobacteriota bacterium]
MSAAAKPDSILRRELQLVDVFTITTGAMISSGLFILPGIAFEKAGPAVILSYFLAGLLALPTMLCAAELATAMPRAGGVYFFASRSLGFGIGTVAGFARWFAMSLKCAFSLIGIGVFSSALTGADPAAVSIGTGLLFIGVNLAGIRLVGWTQTLLTGALGVLLITIAASGLPEISADRYTPFAPYGLGPVFSTAGFIFISYGGMLSITGLAEEVRRPRRNIPLGMLLALAFTGTMYALVIAVAVGTLDPESLKNTLTPISDSTSSYLGRAGIFLTTAAALLAFVTTANAGIAAASRYPLAMSRDGLLPACFKRSRESTGIPHVSVLATGGFVLGAVLLLKLDMLVEVASSLLLLTYILTNFAVIVMRRRNKEDYRPAFRVPLCPWLPLASSAGLALLLAKISAFSFLFILLFVCAVLVWRALYARHLSA